MKLVAAGRAGRRDVDVTADLAQATVADLARALDAAPPGAPDRDAGLVVEGLWAPGDLSLLEAGVHEGAVVQLDRQAPAPVPPPGVVEVAVVAGLHAGMRVQLGAGTHLVGRSAEASVVLDDATVSRQHCVLEVSPDGSARIWDRSSSGTFVDGRRIADPVPLRPGAVVETGAVAWVVRPPVEQDRLTGADRFRDLTPSGLINLNRPPRFAPPAGPERLATPKAPSNANTAPFSLVAIVAPAVMGAVMVVVLKNVAYLAFAGLSPIMALGNWWESKHRSTRALRTETRRYAADLQMFESELARAHQLAQQQRRARTPDVAEVLRRAAAPSAHLWERRLGHADFGALTAGIGDAGWVPELAHPSSEAVPEEVGERLARYGKLISVPLAVELAAGGVVGVVGERSSALAVARSLLVQAAVHHGPADLRVAVAAIDDASGAWDWAKWLPHTRDHRPGPANRRLLATSVPDATVLLEGLIASRPPAPSPGTPPPGPVTLLVVDGEELLSGRASPARAVLRGDAGPSAGIVLAATPDRLPSLCTSIVTVDDTGAAKLSEPRQGVRDQDLLAAGVREPEARECARVLARYEDPELQLDSAVLPELVPLLDVLSLDPTPSAVAERWEGNGGFHLRAPIGAASAGQFWLDFDRHGPHGLIGGTTGSGKSELLKTLVAAFAASYPPSELTFGLFDFKGGSTFVEFADLPHTVGMASDLDVSLARRALQCLRAELLYRERCFDEVGAKDLADYRARSGAAPLPRLVVIIDEFAALASELAEEIGALTDLTARGRSLGVHLLLATQKPSTAVNSEIRTNTRLRISLQVEDKQDSLDVVGVSDAAMIRHKGRGFFRVGSSEIVPIQTALSSGRSDASSVAVSVAPFTFGPAPSAPPPTTAAERPDADHGNDLGRLVGAIGEAFAASGASLPRRPWPDPLPTWFGLDDLPALADSPAPDADPTVIPFLLADDPAAQTRYPAGWSLAQGNLLVYGVVGSGTTTALTSIALAFAGSRPPDRGHIYAMDFGTGGLAALARLPHCGAVIPATDRERHIRLVRMLRGELQRRRQLAKAELDREPTILLLIDNVEAFRAEFDDAYGMAIMDQAIRLFSEGPDAGLYIAATANRVGGIPPALSAATPQKLVMRLADIGDYGSFSIPRRALPTFLPGRGLLTARTQTVQVASPAPDLSSAVAALAAAAPAVSPAQAPRPVGVLPDEIALAELPVGTVTDDEWRLPVALADADLAAAPLVLYEQEHATVGGAARSGKSTALLTIAAALRRARPEAAVLGIACRRSPLRGHPAVDKLATSVDEIAAVVDTALVASGPTLLLIDDAEGIDDGDGRLAQLLAMGHRNVHLAIAGRSDVLRTQYGHWTQTVRRSKAGLLLNPNLDLDGDLLGTRLPSRLHTQMVQGRGFLIGDGRVDLVQVARQG